MMKALSIRFWSAVLAALMLLGCVPSCGRAEASGDLTLASYALECTEPLRFSGVLTASEPFYALHIWVRDERTASTESETWLRFPDGALSCKAEALNAAFRHSVEWKRGEKTVFIATENGEEMLFRARFYVLGDPREAVGAAKDCIFMQGRDRLYDLTGGRANAGNRLNGGSVVVTLPENFGAGTMLIAWSVMPEAPQVKLIGRNGKTRTVALTEGMYVNHIVLDENVESVEISAANHRASLCYVALFAQDAVPPSAQLWEEAREDLDILFVSTHQDDEFLFFGGAIPYYAALGKNIAVAYSVDCGVYRYYEALAALWSAGCTAHPLFLGYDDVDCSTFAQVGREWSKQGDLLNDLVRLIRQYRPKVIVTQDEEGEYGHVHHKYTVAMVEQAVKLAADATYDEDSVRELGTWQTLKLYSHLYEQDRIYMDWSQPVAGGDGISALELARVAFNHNASQIPPFSMEVQGVRYDNSCFGLVFSAVGEDVEKNDFLENIK